MVANILPADPHFYPDPGGGVGSKGQNSTFSEYGYVAYQIKGNGKKNLNVIMFHIKLRGKKYRLT